MKRIARDSAKRPQKRAYALTKTIRSLPLGCARGTVSVYLIILILPVFLLNALFVDLIRLRLAGRETETAAKAGLRSIMSRYDAGLQSYGLYGLDFDKDKLVEEFREITGSNLSSSVTDSTFRYIDNRLETEATDIRGLYTLANPVEFERQILQEMKYRAPIAYTLELAEPFKRSGSSGAMRSASQFYDEAAKLEEIGEKRDEALDEAWAKAEQLARTAEGFSDKYESRLSRMSELAKRIGLYTLDDIKSKIDEIGEAVERAKDRLDSLNKRLRSKKSDLRDALQNGASDVSGLREDIEELKDDIDAVTDDIAELTDKRKEWEQLLADFLEYMALSQLCKSESAVDAGLLDDLYEALSKKLDKAQAADNELSAELTRIRASASDRSPYLPAELYDGIAPYGMEYFSKYRLEAGKINAAYQAIHTRWASLGMLDVSSYGELSGQLATLRTLAQDFRANQGAEEAKRMDKSGNLKRQKQNAQSKMRSALSAAKSAWGSCSMNGSDPYDALYKKLEGDGSSADKGLYGKYLAYQGEAGETASTVMFAIEDDEKTSKGAMSFLSKLSDALESLRDEFYTNEFALSKFNYRTIGLPAGSAPANELSLPESHPLAAQEAEYLLYGFNSCAKNYSAAYGEMFVLLLGIRTTEALMEPKSLGLGAATPLLTFLVAAAEGAYRAAQDMNKLLQGESVAVFQKIKAVTVNYKQLFRLFYLVHSQDRPMMARMQALLELNTGKDLTAVVTSVQGAANSSVQLWFLPGFAKWFPDGSFGGRLSGKRWQIQRTAVFAYD